MLTENPWFVLAFFMIVVGLPVVLGIWGEAHKRHLRYKEKELEVLGSQTAEKAAQYAARTTELEQRVRVLEQIVTDGGMQTAAQMEALRDRPSLGERTN
jgi:NADH:ubiquinone oxidoreductase subunit D